MIQPPSYLPKSHYPTWEALAPTLELMGTLRSTDVDALARYILMSAEYTSVSAQAIIAINAGDVDEVDAWLKIQTRLAAELEKYETRFGLTAKSRKDNGWILPQT